MPIFAFILVLFTRPRLALADASGADFLLQDMDARVMAQGGAGVARPHDLNGLRSNPAGLGGLKNPQATFTHLNSTGDWDQDWLAGAMPLGRVTCGLELLSSRMRPYTYYDDTGREAGTLNAGSLEGAITVARAFGDSSLGGTFRLFRGQLAEYSNWGYAGDLGAQWRPFSWACIGAAVQHLGEQTAYYSYRDPLPTLWRAGAQFQGQPIPELGLTLGADALQSQDPVRGSELRVGGEAEFSKRLSLRGGAMLQDQAWGPTFGLGFKLAGMELSYAYRPIEALGADHVLTLSLQDLALPR